MLVFGSIPLRQVNTSGEALRCTCFPSVPQIMNTPPTRVPSTLAWFGRVDPLLAQILPVWRGFFYPADYVAFSSSLPGCLHLVVYMTATRQVCLLCQNLNGLSTFPRCMESSGGDYSGRVRPVCTTPHSLAFPHFFGVLIWWLVVALLQKQVKPTISSDGSQPHPFAGKAYCWSLFSSLLFFKARMLRFCGAS
jgi:hypothetical protein